MNDQHTWRERHPFLYGLSQTFGIFGVLPERRDPMERSFDRIERALDEAEKRQQ